MKLLYAVMYTEFAQFLGNGALYADGKVMLKGLTEAEIDSYDGKINRLDLLGLNPSNDTELTGLSTKQFSNIITKLVEQEPNETLGVLSLEQGWWLYDNHVTFKPVDQ